MLLQCILVSGEPNPTQFIDVQNLWRDKTPGPGVQVLKSSKFSFSLFWPWVGFISGQKIQQKFGYFLGITLLGFKVQFWWINLGSNDFELHPVKFETVQSSICFGSILH